MTVGSVEKIELGADWTAQVTLGSNVDVDLPANAVAGDPAVRAAGREVRQLAPPADEKPRGRARATARSSRWTRTSRNAEVEELLGALSLVLNGGGLAQLQTINRELGGAGGPRGRGRSHARPARHVRRRAATSRRRTSTAPWTGSTASPRSCRRTATLDKASRHPPGSRSSPSSATRSSTMLREPDRPGRRRHAGHPGVSADTVADLQAARADPHPAQRGREGPGPPRSSCC